MPVQAVLISSLVTNHYEPEGKMLILQTHLVTYRNGVFNSQQTIWFVYLLKSGPQSDHSFLKSNIFAICCLPITLGLQTFHEQLFVSIECFGLCPFWNN